MARLPKPRLPKPLRRTLRHLGRKLRWTTHPLQVVYHDEYVAAFPDLPVDPHRAENILAFLATEGLVIQRAVHRPEPAWWKSLERVHDSDYLDRLRDPAHLTSILGVPIDASLVDRIIDHQRLQTGGTMMAVRRARQRGVAVNLGGGFHHAHRAQGGGFCLFNDVAAAIVDERRRGFRGRVLVVDLDLHDGDGTRSIFREDDTVHTFSIHARHWVDDVSAVESTSLELGSKVEDDVYLETLREHLPPLFERFCPRLVIYLAGCDPAHDDPLGDWRLSAEALLERDLLVTRLARDDRKIPFAILLAGGYGPRSWRYTARFLSALELGEAIEPPSSETMTLERYRAVARRFTSAELSGGDTDDLFGITEEDLVLPGWSGAPETRFLGFYTKNAVELVTERAGFLDRLRDLGYAHPTLDLQVAEPGGDTLRVYGEPEREHLLVELRLRRDRRTFDGLELLSVEWLLMQNPRLAFGPTRTRLPGQNHPGLGLLSDLVAMLILICERLHLDGLVFTPSEFHVAAYGRNFLVFLDPAAQARFEALLDLFAETGTPLPAATRAVAEGRVVDAETGEPVAWDREPMVLAVSPKMEALVASRREAGREARGAEAGEDARRPRFALRPE